MTDFDAIASLLEKGLSVLFIWLFLQKDKELRQLWSDRLSDAKNWIDTLTAVIVHQEKPTPPPLMKQQRLLQSERESSEN